MNTIHTYLSVNFLELKTDAQKEKQLLRKLGPGEERGADQSVLAASMQFGLAIEFERSDPVRRFRLFLSEILHLMSKVHRHVYMCVCTLLKWRRMHTKRREGVKEGRRGEKRRGEEVREDRKREREREWKNCENGV